MLAGIVMVTEGLAAPKTVKQKTFNSAEDASQALFNAARSKDSKEITALFGPTGKDAVISRDEAVNKDLYERFVKAYEQKNRLDISPENRALLYVGNNEWSFPVPIAKKGDKWFFDTKQGRAEILQRRIGRNELDTIQSCLAYVDAQKDYARMTGTKDASGEYAQKFVSDPGTRNGLYWETKGGEEPSPLGFFMARARKEGVAAGQIRQTGAISWILLQDTDIPGKERGRRCKELCCGQQDDRRVRPYRIPCPIRDDRCDDVYRKSGRRCL